MIQTKTWGAAAACAILLVSVAPAKALRVAIPNRTPAQQAMTAEVIVVGKVVEIEKELTKATSHPSVKEKIDYHVGVVKISESIQGAKGLTTIRVGWQPTPRLGGPGGNLEPAIQPAIQPIRRPPFQQPQASLTEGQEGCFFLTKHHDGDFYVLQQFGSPLDKKSADFDKQLSSVKKLLKTYEDPKSALKAKDAADRQFAAIMLVQKYRTYPQVNTPNVKVAQEGIDAEESKLILQTLSEMEWNKVDANGMSLQNVWYQIGVQPKDGWVQPKFVQGQDFNKIMGEAVAKWLKENAEKYRVQRYSASK